MANVDQSSPNDAGKQALLSALRTLLASGGGLLVTNGVISASTLQDLIGAVMVLAPLIWGVWDKYRSEHATQARTTVAVQAGIAAVKAGAIVNPAAVSKNTAQEIIQTYAPEKGVQV